MTRNAFSANAKVVIEIPRGLDKELAVLENPLLETIGQLTKIQSTRPKNAFAESS